jgi:hypothetical protein
MLLKVSPIVSQHSKHSNNLSTYVNRARTHFPFNGSPLFNFNIASLAISCLTATKVENSGIGILNALFASAAVALSHEMSFRFDRLTAYVRDDVGKMAMQAQKWR